MVTKKGMLRLLRRARPGLRTGRSESDPMVTATKGCPDGDDGMEVVVEDLGIERPFLPALIISVIVMRGWINASPWDIESATIVICPIFLAGLDSLPYICNAALGIAMACLMISLCAVLLAPPGCVSMINVIVKKKGNMS